LNGDETTPAIARPQGAAQPSASAVGPNGAGPSRARPKPGWPLDSFPRALLIVLGANTLIAAFFSLVLRQAFLSSLVQSQAIGLSIFSLSWALHRVGRAEVKRWKISAVAISLGGVLGIAVARLLEGGGLARPFLEQPRALAGALAGALVFGVIVSYYFHSRAAVAEGRARLRDEMLRRLEDEQRLTEAELKLLQAQIEPHFLFNTLSNVLQLVDADPQGAKRMLMNLTSYLRASLRRTRAGATTLGEELDLVRAYLEIQAVRMGARLAYRIDCPPELRELELPPLLLQPLVENSVRHGLESRPGGGEVLVQGRREGDALLLEVKDTGLGLASECPAGVGLTNVRARIRAVSHGRGSMVIHPNTPHGLSVSIALPLSEASAEDNARVSGRADEGPRLPATEDRS
jgi:signal transduction histidine kinase